MVHGAPAPLAYLTLLALSIACLARAWAGRARRRPLWRAAFDTGIYTATTGWGLVCADPLVYAITGRASLGLTTAYLTLLVASTSVNVFVMTLRSSTPNPDVVRRTVILGCLAIATAGSAYALSPLPRADTNLAPDDVPGSAAILVYKIAIFGWLGGSCLNASICTMQGARTTTSREQPGLAGIAVGTFACFVGSVLDPIAYVTNNDAIRSFTLGVLQLLVAAGVGFGVLLLWLVPTVGEHLARARDLADVEPLWAHLRALVPHVQLSEAGQGQRHRPAQRLTRAHIEISDALTVALVPEETPPTVAAVARGLAAGSSRGVPAAAVLPRTTSSEEDVQQLLALARNFKELRCTPPAAPESQNSKPSPPKASGRSSTGAP